ncbi:hypothetical protein ZIOFF_052587 [Zingiber officinale]|uniref:Cytochrome P450 n=1 Tax=Zingiber officinale TaxID=94328 RepID=A0A8J5KIS7_ZINOF|nr:hypothetical protein ZIOFF_052587 [Zingiber officinale]
MAIMDMKTVAVAVVRHFDFEVLGGEGRKTPKFALGLTVSLAGGLPVQRKLREAIRVVNVLTNDLIDKRRKLGCANGQDLLLRHDDEYLRDIMVSFLLTRRDTVASALTNCFFWLLARHVEVSGPMREEIDRVLLSGSEAIFVMVDKKREMQYVHAAIFESMQLFPPVQFDSKFCTVDDMLLDGMVVQVRSLTSL